MEWATVLVIGSSQKPTRKVSSIWALGCIVFLLIEATIRWGVKGFIGSIPLGLLFLFVAAFKY